MKEEELIKIWKSSPDEELVRLKKSGMINDMQSNIDHLLKMPKGRNTLIKLMVIFVFPIFGMMAYTTPSILSKIGVILMLLSYVYVIIRFKSIKKLKPRSYSETYIDYLYEVREQLKVEKKLWDDMLYQSALPCMIGAILFRVGYFKDTRDLIIRIAVFLGLGIVGYFYYRKAVKKQFTSRLEKVEELIKIMEE